MDEFKYIQKDFEPLLVLGIKMDPNNIEHYKFKPGKNFINIAHQTGGLSCHQHYMVGIVLKPKWHILVNMQSLVNKWLDTNVGVFGAQLNDVVEYREDLKRFFQMDCNESYTDFQEAIYPIDCTHDNLRQLTDDTLPDHLDDLIQFEDAFQSFVGSVNRWNLYILGPNCD